MPTYILGEPTVQGYYDASGDPLSGGSVEFYLAGTSTPTNVFQDDSGTSAGTSVTLNSLGQPQNGSGTAIPLYFDIEVSYKIIVKDSSGTQQGATIDPYEPAVSAFYSSLSVDAPAGTASEVRLSSGDSLRWLISKTSDAEAGSDAGSYLAVAAYGDGGTTSTAIMTVTRDTVTTTFPEPVSFSSSVAVAGVIDVLSMNVNLGGIDLSAASSAGNVLLGTATQTLANQAAAKGYVDGEISSVKAGTTVTGTATGNAALQSLLTALDAIGIITDSTT